MSTDFSTSEDHEEVVLSKQIKESYPSLACDRYILQEFELSHTSRFSTIFLFTKFNVTKIGIIISSFKMS